MVKRLAVLFVLLAIVAVPAMAQEYRANLYLTIVTEDGSPVSGANVKVSGIGAERTGQSDDQGKVRFIKLEPGFYTVEVSKDGFNTAVYTRVQLSTSGQLDMDLQLQRSEVVERIEVVSQTPILDKRKLGTNTVVDPEEISKIPTARDPWAVMSTIPGMQTDRINVGGNQSGQQAGFVGKGDSGDNATWVMDGVEFTDLAAQGGSSTYFDFNSFNEIAFKTGGGDLEQTSPGQQLNFTTKQGTNRHQGSLGLVFTDDAFQDGAAAFVNPADGDGDGEPDPVSGNQISEVFEKTFEIGGPIVSDKAWYWFGFSQNDIDVRLPGATPADPQVTDRTKLQNVTGKVNATLGGDTNIKGYYTRGDKIKIGRNAGPDRPQPTSWNQSGPTPIYTGDVSHFWTPNIETSLQLSHVGGGFQLIPQGTADQILWDSNFVWQNTFIDYVTTRPTDAYALRGNWFAETGNVSHEFKFGFKLKEGEVQSFSGYGTQNVIAAEWLNTAYLYRKGTAAEDMEYTNIWVGDTMIFGNWTFNVGAVQTTQKGKQLPSVSPANGLCPTCLPDLTFTGFDPGVEWDDTLVRGGVTYTFDTNKRQLVRASFGQYVDQLAATDVAFNHVMNPSSIGYDWIDDGDLIVEIGEFDPDCVTGPVSANNVDPCNPAAASTPVDHIDPNYSAPSVDELIVGYEIELARDFTVAINYTDRTRDNTIWNPLQDLSTAGDLTDIIPSSLWVAGDDGLPGSDITGTITCYTDSVAALPGSACEIPQGGSFTVTPYTLTAAGTALTNVSRPQVRTNRPGYEEQFEGFELVATKRLSNNWMLRGFFAIQDWTKTIPAAAIQSPANLVGDTTVSGSDVVVGGGTNSGGFGNVFLGTASWQANINGLYQLPKNFTIAGNLQAREGYALPTFYQTTGFADADGTNANQALQLLSVDTFRLDDIQLLDLRGSYLLQMEGGTTVDLSLEIFNVFDEDTILQVQRRLSGNSAGVISGTNLGSIFEALSPRIFRLGARVTFK